MVQQSQVSPAFPSGGPSASFFSGSIAPHRAAQSPTLDVPESGSVEEMGSSIRTPVPHLGGHHPNLSQHNNRVSSFGEEGQDALHADGLGELS